MAEKSLTTSEPVWQTADWAGCQAGGWLLSVCWPNAQAALCAGTYRTFSRTHCLCLTETEIVVSAKQHNTTQNKQSFIQEVRGKFFLKYTVLCVLITWPRISDYSNDLWLLITYSLQCMYENEGNLWYYRESLNF